MHGHPEVQLGKDLLSHTQEDIPIWLPRYWLETSSLWMEGAVGAAGL